MLFRGCLCLCLLKFFLAFPEVAEALFLPVLTTVCNPFLFIVAEFEPLEVGFHKHQLALRKNIPLLGFQQHLRPDNLQGFLARHIFRILIGGNLPGQRVMRHLIAKLLFIKAQNAPRLESLQTSIDQRFV